MVYLTQYEFYPIYEPAEGGYYYEGSRIVCSIKLSKNQAKRRFKQLCKEYQKDSEELWFDDRYYVFVSNYSNDPIIHAVGLRGPYIGDGEMWVIEKNKGSQTSGRRPYC